VAFLRPNTRGRFQGPKQTYMYLLQERLNYCHLTSCLLFGMNSRTDSLFHCFTRFFAHFFKTNPSLPSGPIRDVLGLAWRHRDWRRGPSINCGSRPRMWREQARKVPRDSHTWNKTEIIKVTVLTKSSV